jgi:hypothetical protein
VRLQRLVLRDGAHVLGAARGPAVGSLRLWRSDGQVLALSKEFDQGSLALLTPWGRIKVPKARIVLLAQSAGAPGTWVTLDDGTRLPALPDGESVAVPTQRFGAQTVAPADILSLERQLSAETPAAGRPRLILAGGGIIALGDTAPAPLDIDARGLRLKLTWDRIRSIEREDNEDPYARPRWRISLDNDNSLLAHVLSPTIAIPLASGDHLELPSSAISGFERPE